MRRYTLKFQIVLLFFLISLPALALSLAASRVNMKEAQEQVVNVKQNSMKMLVKQYDTSLEAIENYIQLILYADNTYSALRLNEKDSRYQRVRRKMERVFLKAQFDLVRFSEIVFTETDPEVIADVLAQEMAEGRIVKVAENLYTLSGIMEKAKAAILEKLDRDGTVTIAEVRDLLNTSRKSAKPILEYMDALHITRKEGRESERVAY